jgi:hypothetical protein
MAARHRPSPHQCPMWVVCLPSAAAYTTGVVQAGREARSVQAVLDQKLASLAAFPAALVGMP